MLLDLGPDAGGERPTDRPGPAVGTRAARGRRSRGGTGEQRQGRGNRGGPGPACLGPKASWARPTSGSPIESRCRRLAWRWWPMGSTRWANRPRASREYQAIVGGRKAIPSLPRPPCGSSSASRTNWWACCAKEGDSEEALNRSTSDRGQSQRPGAAYGKRRNPGGLGRAGPGPARRGRLPLGHAADRCRPAAAQRRAGRIFRGNVSRCRVPDAQAEQSSDPAVKADRALKAQQVLTWALSNTPRSTARKPSNATRAAEGPQAARPVGRQAGRKEAMRNETVRKMGVPLLGTSTAPAVASALLLRSSGTRLNIPTLVCLLQCLVLAAVVDICASSRPTSRRKTVRGEGQIGGQGRFRKAAPAKKDDSRQKSDAKKDASPAKGLEGLGFSIAPARAARPAPRCSGWSARATSSSTSSTDPAAWAATAGTPCGWSKRNCFGASSRWTPSTNSRSSSTTTGPCCSIPRGTPGRLAFATDENKERVAGFWSRSRPTGGTDHEDAIRMAIRLQPDVIFLLTDGDDPKLTPGELAKIERLAAGILINTMEFGPGPAGRRSRTGCPNWPGEPAGATPTLTCRNMRPRG